MSLLVFDDGAGSSTGNSYLDIVDFILRGCTDVRQNLRELYRRVAFNIMYGNTDGHFRNHGFLLTPKGWTLSPAYDINPGAKSHQCLLIDSYTEESDINILLSASVSYMLAQPRRIWDYWGYSCHIRDWRKTATELQISLKLLESYSIRWDKLYNEAHSTRFSWKKCIYNFATELKNVANERKSLISSGIMKLGSIRNRISEMLYFKHFGHV